MDISDKCPAADKPLPTVRVPRRSLVVFAGLPGAGKSTLLARLDRPETVSVLDSEQVRARLRTVLPERIPYRWYRFVVHMAHRTRIGLQCAVLPGPIVAHEPSTRATTRLMLVLFGWITRRKRVLVWLDADAAEALAGQYERGRLIRPRSFNRHVQRADQMQCRLRAGEVLFGWNAVHVFARQDLESGLRLKISG